MRTWVEAARASFMKFSPAGAPKARNAELDLSAAKEHSSAPAAKALVATDTGEAVDDARCFAVGHLSSRVQC
jgi:hypothetical protein